MNDLVIAIIIYFVLLAIVMYANYGISRMNEVYDNASEKYKRER